MPFSAKTSLEKMGELSGQVEDQEECATGLICLAAQLAFEVQYRLSAHVTQLQTGKSEASNEYKGPCLWAKMASN